MEASHTATGSTTLLPRPPEDPSSQSKCDRVYPRYILFCVPLACGVVPQQVSQRCCLSLAIVVLWWTEILCLEYLTCCCVVTGTAGCLILMLETGPLYLLWCSVFAHRICCRCRVVTAIKYDSSFHITHPLFLPSFLLLIIVSVALLCFSCQRCWEKTVFCCSHVAFSTLDSYPFALLFSFSQLLKIVHVCIYYNQQKLILQFFTKRPECRKWCDIHDMWPRAIFPFLVLRVRFCPRAAVMAHRGNAII